jgi:hypothetical protein
MKGSYLARLITLVVVAALLALGVGVTAPAQAENTTQIVLGIDRALLAKASAVELTGSPSGKGAWFVDKSTTKMELYLDPTKPPLDALGSFKIDDIKSISYKTKKPLIRGAWISSWSFILHPMETMIQLPGMAIGSMRNLTSQKI